MSDNSIKKVQMVGALTAQVLQDGNGGMVTLVANPNTGNLLTENAGLILPVHDEINITAFNDAVILDNSDPVTIEYKRNTVVVGTMALSYDTLGRLINVKMAVV